MDGGANFGGGGPQKPAKPEGIPWRAAVISDKPGRIGRLLGVRRKDGPRSWRMHWGEFNWNWGFAFDLINWEEERDWSLHLRLLYADAFIKLPFLPKRSPPSQDHMEQWGFSWTWSVDDRGDAIHLHWGRHSKIVHMPWSWGSCVRSEMLCADGVWCKHKLDFELAEGEEPAATEMHPYRYVCTDGRVQNVNATIGVQEREWRWAVARRLHLPWPRMIQRTIDVTFTAGEDGQEFDGVGDRAGSYKGGTIGCGYQMKPGEMPVDTLRRMQRERRFR